MPNYVVTTNLRQEKALDKLISRRDPTPTRQEAVDLIFDRALRQIMKDQQDSERIEVSRALDDADDATRNQVKTILGI